MRCVHVGWPETLGYGCKEGGAAPLMPTKWMRGTVANAEGVTAAQIVVDADDAQPRHLPRGDRRTATGGGVAGCPSASQYSIR